MSDTNYDSGSQSICALARIRELLDLAPVGGRSQLCENHAKCRDSKGNFR